MTAAQLGILADITDLKILADDAAASPAAALSDAAASPARVLPTVPHIERGPALPASALKDLAADAVMRIAAHGFDPAGNPTIDIGRQKRLFPWPMRRAIYLLDRMCTEALQMGTSLALQTLAENPDLPEHWDGSPLDAWALDCLINTYTTLNQQAA